MSVTIVDHGIEYSGNLASLTTTHGIAAASDHFFMRGEPPAGVNLIIGIEIYDGNGDSVGKIHKKWKDLNERYVKFTGVPSSGLGAGEYRLGAEDSKDLLHIEIDIDDYNTNNYNFTSKLTYAGNTKGNTVQGACSFFNGNGYGEISGLPIFLGASFCDR